MFARNDAPKYLISPEPTQSRVRAPQNDAARNAASADHSGKIRIPKRYTYSNSSSSLGLLEGSLEVLSFDLNDSRHPTTVHTFHSVDLHHKSHTHPRKSCFRPWAPCLSRHLPTSGQPLRRSCHERQLDDDDDDHSKLLPPPPFGGFVLPSPLPVNHAVCPPPLRQLSVHSDRPHTRSVR